MSERRIEILRPAYEKRHDDPARDYGIGAVRMRFSHVTDHVAVSLTVNTGWYLPHVRERLRREHPHRKYGSIIIPSLGPTRFDEDWMPCCFEGEGMAMVIHTDRRTSDWQADQPPDKCDVLPGGECWGDVGFMAAEELFEVLVAGGEDALFSALADIGSDYKPAVPNRAAFRRIAPRLERAHREAQTA